MLMTVSTNIIGGIQELPMPSSRSETVDRATSILLSNFKILFLIIS